MGNALTERSLDAFVDELKKEAFLGDAARRVAANLRHPTKLSLTALGKVGRFSKGLFRGGEEAGRRVMSPVSGMLKGWESMSPMTDVLEKTKALGFNTPSQAGSKLKRSPEKLKALLGGGGTHLLSPSVSLSEAARVPSGKITSVAEELSRRGWTGAGRATKYLPVGQKGLTAGFSALAVPDIVHANEATPTGEGAVLERGLGELGSVSGMLLGAGLGFVPAAGLWYGANTVGSRLGRILDRVRSGASFKDAVVAPSPTEAAEQLDTINRYYGGG